MIDKEPQADDPQHRYLANLANIESKNLADFMPEGLHAGDWQLADDIAVSKFRASYNGLYGDAFFSKQLVAIYQDRNSGTILAGPAFTGKYQNATSLFLNIVLAARQIAPWSQIDSIGQDFYKYDKRAMYTYTGTTLELPRKVLEQIVNGIGDEK